MYCGPECLRKELYVINWPDLPGRHYDVMTMILNVPEMQFFNIKYEQMFNTFEMYCSWSTYIINRFCFKFYILPMIQYFIANTEDRLYFIVYSTMWGTSITPYVGYVVTTCDYERWCRQRFLIEVKCVIYMIVNENK